jgi:hypothetical protein
LLVATLLLFWCGSRMFSLVISLLRSPHNQIANVDSLPRPVISSGLHRAGSLGRLQFAQICMDCVWLSALSFCAGEFLFLLQFNIDLARRWSLIV